MNERGLWGFRRHFRNLKNAEIHIPNFDTSTFLDACVSEGCALTLYMVAKQLDTKQVSGDTITINNDWEHRMHATILDWLQQLPCVIDGRMSPLIFLLISKSDAIYPTNDKNGLTKTLSCLRGIQAKANPSLLSRVATYMRGQNRNCLLNWGNDPNAQNATNSMLQKLIETVEEIIDCGNQNVRSTLLRELILREDRNE